ncbi:MAG TPA: Ca2+-dependent phosphoinositide-specific phospholipase C [Acidimicrobiia bacterium]|nr:Ca2+-dependent phosphoinositide-specific phospholipase C [Acidimicrobiia bacterium]
MSARRVARLVAVGLTGLVAWLAAPAATSSAAPSEPLRINQFQALGSHNSYHVEQSPETLDFYLTVDPTAYNLAYTHPPLTDQLALGVRQLELDVFADPAGDRFAPIGTPGFKVLHIDLIDEGSQCPRFVDCLTELAAWSDAHPTHMPIAILLEVKEGFIKPTGPVTPAQLLALDAEIRSVFGPDDLVTPDFVRGAGRDGGADGEGTVYPDVESAILDAGWPRLDDTRGRFMFLLDGDHDEYVNGDPTLAGRVAFPPSTPGHPEAAFVKVDDPQGVNLAMIQQLVADGYLVRTRADLPVDTGLSGDGARLTAALASGAQWVSGDYLTPTDYARYDAAFAARYNVPFDPGRPPYQTVIPGGTPARCNPVTAPLDCRSSDVEHLVERPAVTSPTVVTPVVLTPVVVAPRFTA